jgi:hypothetical protein
MDRGPLVSPIKKIKKWNNGKVDRWEEIRQRWGRGGDPPEMGQREDSRRPAAVPGGGGAVASPRKKKITPTFLFFLFYFLLG